MSDRPASCCPACGTHNEAAAVALARVTLLEDAQVDLQNELIASRAKNTRLREDRNSRRLQDPLMALAQPIFDYWKKKLSPTAHEFSGKRLDAVLARLRAVPTEEIGARHQLILKAIDGAALLPYVTDNGRAKTGKPSEKQTELELICRSESHLHRFASYIEKAPDAPVTVTQAPLRVTQGEAPLFMHRPLPYERVLTTLRVEYGSDTVLTFSGRREFYGVCPVHQQHLFPPQLRVVEEGGIKGAKLDFTCTEGCLPSIVREKLLEMERAQEARIAGDGTYRRLALLLAAMSPETLIATSASVAGAPEEAVAA